MGQNYFFLSHSARIFILYNIDLVKNFLVEPRSACETIVLMMSACVRVCVNS